MTPRTPIPARPERSDRVKWLRANRQVLKMDRRQVVAKMKELGLLRPSTYYLDVNLYNLMRDAGYSRRDSAKFSAGHDYLLGINR